MKQVVVFFSRDGSTRVFAQAIANKVGADVFELVESDPIKGFLSAAWSAITGKKSELVNDFSKETSIYDKIYVGSPVWGGKATPAVNTFFANAKIKGKEIVFFTVQGAKTDGKPIGGAKRMVKDLEKKSAKSASAVSFTGAGKNEDMSLQDAKEQVEARI